MVNLLNVLKFLRFFVIAHVANFFGPFRVFAFTFATILLILISAGLISPENDDNLENESQENNNQTQLEQNLEDVETWKNTTKETLNTSIKADSLPTQDQELDEVGLDKALSGDNHLRIIAALCFLLFTVHHDVFLFLILMAFIVAIFFKTGIDFKIKLFYLLN